MYKTTFIRKILSSLFILSLFSVSAQVNSLGVHAGACFSNVLIDGSKIEKDMGLGYRVGLTYEYMFQNDFYVGADLLIVQKGFKEKYVIVDFMGNNAAVSTRFTNYNYLSVPLKVGFSKGDFIKGYGGVGIVPSILVSAGTRLPGKKQFGFASNYTEISEDVAKYDLGFMLTSGARFQYSEVLLFFASIAYEHGLTSLTNKNYFSGSRVQNFGFSFSLGASLVLNNL